MYSHTDLHACTHMHTHTHAHTRMHAHTHTHTHIYTHRARKVIYCVGVAACVWTAVPSGSNLGAAGESCQHGVRCVLHLTLGLKNSFYLTTY